MRPGHEGMCCDRTTKIFLGFGIWCLFELASKVEVVPTDDGVLDEAVAGFRDFLLLLLGLGELAGVAYGDGAGESIGQFDLVEMALDGLPQSEIVDIS